MKSLYIMGTPASGKTALALGLAQKLQKEGYRVSYFKPIGSPSRRADGVDDDAVLMKEVLQMDLPLEVITPRLIGPSYLLGDGCREAREKIREAYARVSAGADVVLIGGAAYPYAYAACGLDDITLARELGSPALLVVNVESDTGFDRTLFFNRAMVAEGVKLLGNVFNNIPRPLLAKTEGIYRPILEEKGYRVLGIIPRRPEIASPTVEEFYEVLGGEVLAGAQNMGRLVEDVMVGAMTAESALNYFRRSADKAVILGGDRADVALAALETSTSVLILTGGLYPDVRVLARAQEKGVPVILVHYDTYTTIEKISHLTRRLKPGDTTGIKVALENVEKFCQWQEIIAALA
ncbi:phosphotransacetylase family protein [Desulfovirgula thermocuniculi]|uniref:phosphotransacetylase family protein n=1 Tax=Desulfovirgula thermocuniculi TaxID=348842 RepID=UPI000420221E|nr:phosphotransacetylase family protein [Desulfovirgula thermocuniculi]